MSKNDTIKRLGMQKEFANWLVDVKQRNKGFKYGDRVELIEPREYGKFKKGDVATVLKRDESAIGCFLTVEFDEDPGSYYTWYQNRFRLFK